MTSQNKIRKWKNRKNAFATIKGELGRQKGQHVYGKKNRICEKSKVREN